MLFCVFLAKNVLSCIQAKLDSIKAKLNEKHLSGVAESINKFSTRKSIDERNNNSDYEEPCKRPKIDLGSSSPIYSVRPFYRIESGSNDEIGVCTVLKVVLLIAKELIKRNCSNIYCPFIWEHPKIISYSRLINEIS